MNMCKSLHANNNSKAAGLSAVMLVCAGCVCQSHMNHTSDSTALLTERSEDMDPVTVCMINTVYRDMMLFTSKDATYLNWFQYFEVSLDFLHFVSIVSIMQQLKIKTGGWKHAYSLRKPATVTVNDCMRSLCSHRIGCCLQSLCFVKVDYRGTKSTK